MNIIFEIEEFLKLSRELERYHSVFYRLWNLGNPIFTDKITTAAVQFDKLGDGINFLINPDFWSKLSWPEKEFTICHESLHIILNHGLRIRDLQSDPIIINKALDIVVNHSLIERFGFERIQIDPENKYCWIDTVFDDPATIQFDKAFEHYYNLLTDTQQKTENKHESEIVDDHSHLEDFSRVIEKLNDEMPQREKESLQSIIEKHSLDGPAGGIGGTSWIFTNVGVVKKKKKWETVIRQWSKKYLKDAEEEQWSRKNRRFNCLDDDLMLPSNAEIEASEKDKIDVFAFLDSSGSCRHLANRFFKAMLSLPTDRFDLKTFCFDTKVYEVDLKNRKLCGFGGTSFSCIENYIQSYMKKNNKKYPHVFVISDGFANKVSPQIPQNWYFFLSTNYVFYVPPKSKIFMLKDYE